MHGVFDGVGKDTFDSDFDLVRRKGTIVTCGNASGPVPPFAPLKLGPKNLKGACFLLLSPSEKLLIFSTDDVWGCLWTSLPTRVEPVRAHARRVPNLRQGTL